MNEEQEDMPHALSAAEEVGIHEAVEEFSEDVSSDDEDWRYKEEDLKSSPLIAAAAIGDLETVQSLFSQGYPNKNETTNHGSTAINIAAWKGHLSVVSFLAENGADLEKKEKSGLSPLHVAVANNHLDIVRYLVEQGADKDSVDSDGDTPLITAIQSQCFDVVWFLLEQGADIERAAVNSWTPLLYASSLASGFELARYLLEQGVDRDKADNEGCTPLHIAAEQGRLETTKLLMVYGAALNARDNYGRLPIDLTDDEEIKQAIRDEPRRRMDEAPGKRATEQDRHPNAATSASVQQEEDKGEEQEEPNNKKPRLNEGEAEEGKIAEEDEDSEPSSDEDD